MVAPFLETKAKKQQALCKWSNARCSSPCKAMEIELDERKE